MDWIFVCLIFSLNLYLIFANCPTLSPPIGGIFVNSCRNSTGSICVIKCRIDKITHKRKCLEDGTWTGGIIRCHRK